MGNILLVEPDYRSKFPPLGLMKISTYHKRKSDSVTFVRGKNPFCKTLHWHRIYIASLFTWELPRTIETIKYYQDCVNKPADIYVGGIGATLLPDYIRNNTECTIIIGQIEKRGVLGRNSPPISSLIPDYDILKSVEYNYQPDDAYFTRITKGCVRTCKFCAVPILEPDFGLLAPIEKQIEDVNKQFGEKQNLVIMDNNILAVENLDLYISKIADLGFARGDKRNNKLRSVDFNQGIDARLISESPSIAPLLCKISLNPIRLALDFLTPQMEKDYRKAIMLLHGQGFRSYTNYLLYNFKDTPDDFYRRIMINAEINSKYNVLISGFPMRYIPPTETKRGYVSSQWEWRMLRGIQCILRATYGVISPNPEFICAAFGSSYEEFLEIISMPDRYIIYRKHYGNNEALEWKGLFGKLTGNEKKELYSILHRLNLTRDKKEIINRSVKYRAILDHYYPHCETPSSDKPY